MYKLITVSWLFLLLATSLQAQTKWFNPLEDEHAHYIQNQAWDEDGGNYNRLPARAKGKVRDAVWNLSRESAGLSIRFLTDSKKIQVRYQVTGGYSMPHMPATGVSGVDLYAKGGENRSFATETIPLLILSVTTIPLIRIFLPMRKRNMNCICLFTMESNGWR